MKIKKIIGKKSIRRFIIATLQCIIEKESQNLRLAYLAAENDVERQKALTEWDLDHIEWNE